MIFDAHLDLSMNAMEWNRDLTRSIDEIRSCEQDMNDRPDRGKGMVNFASLRTGNIGVVVGTLIARYTKKNNTLPGASWNSPEQAWAQTQGQLAWYQAMMDAGHLNLIKDYATLLQHLSAWQNNPIETPIGLILSLEGADSILSMAHLEKAYENGLRAIGPAHYGPGTYAYGTMSDGRLPERGKQLLRKMSELNMILDMSHLSDQCFDDAIDKYDGVLWASHNNCRTLVPHQRQYSDYQILKIIERHGVIGIAFDAWMLKPNWVRGISTPIQMGVTLHSVADHIDHICQLAGNSRHVGIGSDLDGAFGREQSPNDMDTIADVIKIVKILESRSYSNEDIKNICSENWINFLKNAW